MEYSCSSLEKQIRSKKISIDDLYNNFKIVEQEVKRNVGLCSSSGSQNMAFVSNPITSNNDDVSIVFGVSISSPQENRFRNQETTRRTVNVEDKSSKEMVAIDEAGFDWSYMADDEAPINMAFMDSFKSEDILIKDSEIAVLKNKLEKISKENDDLDNKIEKSENASQSLDKLIGSQITDKSNRGLGYVSYNVVPPPHTIRFSPPRIDLSHTGLLEFAEPSVQSYRVKPIEVDWESEGEDEVESSPEIERMTVEPSVDKVEVDIPKKNDKHARRPVKYAEMYKTQRPKVLNAVSTNKGKAVKASGHLHKQLEDHGYFDNGCSRHMTRNISYLTDFKEFDEGYVAFEGGAKGDKITGKGIIRTSKLDFEDVYFVNELKFNLFSVSQMCDKKNSVLFTDTECFVLSPDFKLADESHVLLKVTRKNNIYSVDMKNIVPTKDLTCLVAKAINDASMLWHKRFGHITDIC
nr:ribonuclease H-like domain-containing protein [Tanacetum cinerariifolium]